MKMAFFEQKEQQLLEVEAVDMPEEQHVEMQQSENPRERRHSTMLVLTDAEKLKKDQAGQRAPGKGRFVGLGAAQVVWIGGLVVLLVLAVLFGEVGGAAAVELSAATTATTALEEPVGDSRGLKKDTCERWIITLLVTDIPFDDLDAGHEFCAGICYSAPGVLNPACDTSALGNPFIQCECADNQRKCDGEGEAFVPTPESPSVIDAEWCAENCHQEWHSPIGLNPVCNPGAGYPSPTIYCECQEDGQGVNDASGEPTDSIAEAVSVPVLSTAPGELTADHESCNEGCHDLCSMYGWAPCLAVVDSQCFCRGNNPCSQECHDLCDWYNWFPCTDESSDGTCTCHGGPAKVSKGTPEGFVAEA